MSDVAIVTGAGGGIGAAIAQRLLSSGFTVLAGDVEPPPKEEGLHPVLLDVTSEESVEAVAAQISALGDLRAIVNCAGILRPAALADLSAEVAESE
jgi:NAD(P)-dependent dehydrogenase (short-subunit alcohol dehydrogenase family)